jgi:proteasome lid subunit RPN8/RPN11
MSADAEFSITPVRRRLPQYDPPHVGELINDGGGLRLHVRESVLSGIRRHAGDDTAEEVGGILLGRHYKTDTGFLVTVTDHLAVQSDSRSAIHFEFDQRAIAMILARLDGSPEYVVGWWHSHIKGQPFMSVIDHENHRAHFPEPWFVSCVVGAGEWGLPVDFWRFADGEFVSITEYSLDIDAGDNATDAHQDYLAACRVAKSTPSISAGYAETLLPELGLGEEGTAISSLLAALPGSRDFTGSRLDEFRLVIELASAIATHPEAAAEVARLRGQLPVMRSLEGKLVPLVISDQFGDQFAVARWRGLSVTRGSRAANWWSDLRRGLYFPIRVDLPILESALSADGTAWLLTGDGSVLRLTTSERRDGDETEEPSFHTITYTVPRLRGEPLHLAVDESSLWILTSERWYQLALGGNPKEAAVKHVLEPPEADSRVLLGGFVGPATPSRLVTLRGRALQSWGTDEAGLRLIATRELPATWPDWPLTHGCRGGRGLYLLFGTEEDGQLGLFDADTLTLTRQYINDLADIGFSSPSEVLADPFGRIFLRCGQILSRLRP